MNTTLKRMLTLLANHENAARNLRTTLALLGIEPPPANGIPNAPTTNGAGGKFHKAIALDAERRTAAARLANGNGKPKKRSTGEHTSQVRQQRSASAALLAKFDRVAPKTGAGAGLPNTQIVGVFVRRGYLKRKGDGYVRTDKPFHVNPNDPKAAD